MKLDIMNIMRYLSIGFIAIPLFVLAGCGNSETEPTATQQSSSQVPTKDTTEWKEFSSEQGNFAVLMPGTPEEKKSVIETQLGPIDDYTFILKARQDKHQAAYLISYSDYPSGHAQKFDPNDFLERSWQGSFGNLGDRLVYKKNITLNSFAGPEFQYRGKGASTSLVTARNYLVNDRIYQLSAAMTKEQTDKGDAQKYLNSFRLLK